MNIIKLRTYDEETGTFRYLRLEPGQKFWSIMPVGGNIGIWDLFTGLQDRNGTDIYEGDILQHRVFTEEVRLELENPIIDGFDGYSFGWFFIQDPRKSQVIGNIYQNPELTK